MCDSATAQGALMSKYVDGSVGRRDFLKELTASAVGVGCAGAAAHAQSTEAFSCAYQRVGTRERVRRLTVWIPTNVDIIEHRWGFGELPARPGDHANDEWQGPVPNLVEIGRGGVTNLLNG
ncbi:MAG: twin-arginine translocation signal domain-containing protein [Gammaproteobacteria bacterium]